MDTYRRNLVLAPFALGALGVGPTYNVGAGFKPAMSQQPRLSMRDQIARQTICREQRLPRQGGLETRPYTFNDRF